MQEIDDHLYTRTREFCLRCFTLAATYERNYIQKILPWFNPRPWCNPPVVWSAPLFWYDPVINTRVWYGISVYVARSFDRPSFIRTPSFSKHLFIYIRDYTSCFLRMIHVLWFIQCHYWPFVRILLELFAMGGETWRRVFCSVIARWGTFRIWMLTLVLCEFCWSFNIDVTRPLIFHGKASTHFGAAVELLNNTDGKW